MSVVSFGDICSVDRWDGEFFRPCFRELGKKMARICEHKLADFASPSITLFNPDVVSSFQYVEISDVDLTNGETTSKEISSNVTPDRAQFLMNGGEILVSTVRPIRSGIGLLRKGVKGYVASSGFLPLLANDERLRSYLFVWLKLQSTTDWLDRYSKASMYPAVAPADILHVPVLHPGDAILDRIHALVKDIEATLQRGRELYPEAEMELLERMGWNKLQKQKSELFYVENTAELDRMSRVDAEHFQPKNRRLRMQLTKQGAIRVGDFCPLPNRGVQPLFVPDGDVFVLASKAIRPQGVTPVEDARTSMVFRDDAANEKARVGKGDVLLNSTGVGTLGRASFYLEDAPAIADNHVAIIRPDETICLPLYLSLFLNSPAGIAQSEMFQTGSSGQLEIYPHHIQEILVYLPHNRDGSIDLAWQKKLADKVVGASQAKQQAQEILAQAKKLVEDAIEQDENAALDRLLKMAPSESTK